ncbi:MAG TPA: TIGR00304 family protein [Methanobacteriaceae archaeon]|nr:TIGR00304 family protein [Methanobacteriaceae archaeon]HNS25549.1 TIGR00304 family protein [Methanobacteriaceae archaeon]
MIRGEYLVTIGAVAIILGILLLIVGTVLLSQGKGEGSAKSTSQVRGGGVIMIGPIPIIFGSDKGSVVLVVILAIILMFLSYLIFYR